MVDNNQIMDEIKKISCVLKTEMDNFKSEIKTEIKECKAEIAECKKEIERAIVS